MAKYLDYDGLSYFWQKIVNKFTLSPGGGVSITNNTISNTGVRSIASGSSNGTISVNTNGSSKNVAIKGLGSAAYTESTAYASKSDLNSKINGSSTITGIDYVTQETYDALVAAGTMESTVLYIIKEN